jgi:uridylate kinase
MKYRRVIIKLSGEALSGAGNFGFDFSKIKKLVQELKIISQGNVKIGIMIGGGNIFRGRMIKHDEIEKVGADQMGMVATVLNAMCLTAVLNKNQIPTKTISSFEVSDFLEVFSVKKCLSYWAKNNILVFAGGTGNTHFTTDTSAVKMASLLNVDVVLKATQVDGVYDKDPKIFKNAKKFKELTLQQAISKKLKIMDLKAFEMAKSENVKIKVFKLAPGNLKKAVLLNNKIGTIIK